MSLRDKSDEADSGGSPAGDAGDDILSALWELAEQVRRQLTDALRALSSADLTLADAVVKADLGINRRRYVLEEMAVTELRTGGGAEEDRLRLLVAILNVISDLERMGDHAEGIAKIALMLGRPPAAPVPESLARLGRQVEDMLERGLDTFRTRDMERAQTVIREDDEIDQLYEDVYAELLARMGSEAGGVIPDAYLLWAAHNLERIADRTTNICERTIYLSTGRVEELNVTTD